MSASVNRSEQDVVEPALAVQQLAREELLLAALSGKPRSIRTPG